PNRACWRRPMRVLLCIFLSCSAVPSALVQNLDKPVQTIDEDITSFAFAPDNRIVYSVHRNFFFFYCYRAHRDLHSFPTRRSSDLLVIPGGNSFSVSKSQKMLDWVKEVSQGSERVLSVCTGAFVLAKAGLLDGLEATTHHNAIDKDRKSVV